MEVVSKKQSEVIQQVVANTTSVKTKDQTVIITVDIKEDDYKPSVKKILEKYKEKATMKGFRAGKVPMSILDKQYGNGVRADEIQKLVQRSLNSHMKKEKLLILGAPIMIDEDEENASNIDFNKDRNFKWSFEAGLQPDIKINATRKDKLTYLKVKLDDNTIQLFIDDLLLKHGKTIAPDVVEKNDMVYCQFIQVDDNNTPVPNGISNISAIDISKTENPSVFTGAKKSERFWVKGIEISKNVDDLMKVFSVDNREKMILGLQSKYSVEVLAINRHVPANFDQFFFDSVYGKGNVKDEKSFKEKLVDDIRELMKTESDAFFIKESLDYFMKKAKMTFPVDFLKKWLMKTTNNQVNKENVDENYVGYEETLSRELVENKMAVEYNVLVTEEAIKEKAVKSIEDYIVRTNGEITDKLVEESLIGMMNDNKERKKVRDSVYQDLFAHMLKERCTIKEKEISYKEFYDNMNTIG